MELLCAVMKYDWGQLGNNSLVATLAGKNDSSFEVESSTPYAEMWMGTHPNGPSLIKDTKEPLQQYIADNPCCTGKTFEKFGPDIPFLLKILSVRKALSIQVHPNKKDAQKLHQKYPAIYTDDNHKPELAVAITPFEALCGFRPLEEIADFMKTIPELTELIDAYLVQKFIKNPSTEILEDCFKSYITANPITARKCAAKLNQRFLDEDFKSLDSQLEDLFTKLDQQFPGDIGLFSIYFLNHIVLEPGEAIFLNAGLPHAYIHGDCVEVMARSDNVVRAGLTPKVRDVNTLIEIMEYQPTIAENIKFKGSFLNKQIYVYRPPVEDFALSRICVPKKEQFTLPVLANASILIVLHGNANSERFYMQPGTVIFLPSNYSLTFTVEDKLEMYQAYPNF